MGITDIVIITFFIIMILKQLKYIKGLIIPTRKSIFEVVTILFCIFIFSGMIYYGANNWIHYIIGILAIFTILSMWMKMGINLNGFVSMYRVKELILWHEIRKVVVVNSKNIKVKVSDGFFDQTFNFKKKDYNKVIDILKEKLPKQVCIEISFNK